LTLTQTQDKVLVKLSSCGEKMTMQLLANPAAVAQVNVDANLLVVVDPRMQWNPQVPTFGRDNLCKLLVQEKAKRMDAAITRLKHSNRIKSQEQALRNSIVVRISLGDAYLTACSWHIRPACHKQVRMPAEVSQLCEGSKAARQSLCYTEGLEAVCSSCQQNCKGKA